MQSSESIKELSVALCKAQGEVENADKNSTNPAFKSKYADLAEIINTVRPVFTKHGLSFLQMPSFADGVVSVETMLIHTSGEWITSFASAPITKQDPQGVGSAITYLRRYSLAAFACIAQEDDDANHTSQKVTTPAKVQGYVDADLKAIQTCTDIKALMNLWKLLTPAKQELHRAEFTAAKTNLEKLAV